VSGHSVSAAHEKIIGPLAASGSASPNGHRQRAPAVIGENAADSIESPRSPRRTSPGGPAASDGEAEKPAPTQNVSTPSVPARTLGSTDSRSSDMLGSDGPSDNGVAEGAERAVLLATKLRVPAIGGEVVQRATLEHAYTDCQR
jgi:LuxR family maltose regulon positive regulatory protein